MTKTKTILYSNSLFFIVVTTIILGLNLTPLISHIRHSPPGRTFALIHNNAQDFFFYQSLMNLGGSGQWLTQDPYTTEPHQSSIIFSYFLWLGKISKILALPYAITYHLIRIVLSVVFLYFTFYFLLYIKIPHPRLTYFFFVFAAPLMHTIYDNGKAVKVSYMNWWTGMDPIRRVAYLPHHMIGALLLVISIILILKYFNTKTRKYLVYLSVITPVIGFIHTPSLFIILLILPPSLIIHFLSNHIAQKISLHEARNSKQNQNSNDRNNKHLDLSKLKLLNIFRISDFGFRISPIIGLLGYWLIGLSSLLLMVSQTNRGFPWSQYLAWEKNLQFPLDQELIGALGILFPFTLIGVIFSLFSRKFERVLIVCWFTIPFILIPLSQRFNISNIRLIQGMPYLPLAILAVLGISTIQKGLQAILNNISNKFKKFNVLLGYLPAGEAGWVIGLFLILFFIFTLPTLSWSLKDQIREYWPIFGNVYFDNRLNNAFAYINTNFPAKTVTLSTFYTGNYLPAFTNTVSFIGHFGYTYKIDEKQSITRKFFENKMPLDEAKQFIMNNNIALVFQGPEEKPIYKDHLYPTILKPVYDREEVTLYTPNF